MSNVVLVADVGLEARSAGAEAIYTYQADPGTRVGQAFVVPLGGRSALGFVLAVRSCGEEDLGFPLSQLKSLGQRIDGLDLPESTVELVREVAEQTLSPLPVALSLVVPPGVKDRLVTRWELAPAASGDVGKLTAPQTEAIRVLREEGPIIESSSHVIPSGARSAILALRRRGLVARSLALAPETERRNLSGLFRLTPDSAKVEAFLVGPGRKKPAQAVTLIQLQGSEEASFAISELRALSGVTDQTLKALVQEGLLEPVEQSEPTPKPAHDPNPHQRKAIEAISKAVRKGHFERFLLYGVTGSGKTEVYLRAASEALAKGCQVLYLVPEIALTAQVVAQLRERFGRRVAVLHSNMSVGERFESWRRVREGDAPVVLGARSAIFAPLTNLGLVVVDEEHEASYKQDKSPRYETKLLATWLAQRFDAPIVFGSATPCVESFHEAQEGRMQLLRLPERAAAANLPTVFVEDLTEGYRSRKPVVFSESLREKMLGALERKEQIILFLNRRAYAPFLVCRECGYRWECGNCAVSLAFHQKERQLRCHHCDHRQPAPDQCPKCEGTQIKPFGVGSERVEEMVRDEFPGVTVARLDRDVASRKGALEETLAQFRSGAVDVLVGTQMVAKGLDFPNVTVVGVIAADISLAIPDYRASERTFQLLSQVAGRAGRGKAKGEVVIQTLAADHIAVRCAREHDYERFYREIVAERQAAGYPPYKRLVNVLFSGESAFSVREVASRAQEALNRLMPEAELLGPADCPIERVQGLWRRHILLKLEPGADLNPIKAAIDATDQRSVRVVIDVDPSSLL